MIKKLTLILLAFIPFIACDLFPDKTDYAQRVADSLNADYKWQREGAYRAMNEFSKKYSVSQKKMYRVMRYETREKFHIYAYNRKTKARGLCQITEIALLDIPEGHLYFKWIKTEDGKRVRIVNKNKLYNPYWNIRAGFSYMTICERRAILYHRSLPWYLKWRWTEDDVNILLYCWGSGNYRKFISAIRYMDNYDY